MKINETKDFMERVKVYYPSFIVDDYTIKEWHSQLKDYSFQDINEKLNEHLKSEQYGDYIPKLNFLTKYLTKEKDKESKNLDDIYTNCILCGKSIKLSEFKIHHQKCSSIDYIIRQVRKYKNREHNREEIESLSDEKFDSLYEKVIDLTYENSSADEKKYITKYRESLNEETKLD